MNIPKINPSDIAKGVKTVASKGAGGLNTASIVINGAITILSTVSMIASALEKKR